MPAPIIAAIPWIASGIGSLMSLFGKGQPNVAKQSVDSTQALLQAFPQLRQMLDLQARQAQDADPVRRAAMQLATNLAPRSAFGAAPGRPTIGGDPAAGQVPPRTAVRRY